MSDEPGSKSTIVRLPAAATSVATARRVVGKVLTEEPLSLFTEAAVLGVSEVMTNAVVHGRAPIELRVQAGPTGCRVEVLDGDAHLPRVRDYAETSFTGRGLHLVGSVADRWGAEPTGRGKVVWFEVGEPPPHGRHGGTTPVREPAFAPDAEAVELRNVPLLLHWAWQDHAHALLREWLLEQPETDSRVLARHAEAGAAVNLLAEQIPEPTGARSEDLFGSVEPEVTAPALRLRLREGEAEQFRTLAALLAEAASLFTDGVTGSSVPPEFDRLGSWLCAEVDRQTTGLPPTGWVPVEPVAAVVHDPTEVETVAQGLWSDDSAVIAIDRANVMLRVTKPVRDALGYHTESELLGRQLLMLVPEHLRQAHLAGTSLHATTGRDVIIGRFVTLPMLTEDGRERSVRMRVRPHQVTEDLSAYVADLEFLAGDGHPAARTDASAQLATGHTEAPSPTTSTTQADGSTRPAPRGAVPSNENLPGGSADSAGDGSGAGAPVPI